MTKLSRFCLTFALIVFCSFQSDNELLADLLATDSYRIGSDPLLGEYVVGQLNTQPGDLTNLGFADGGYTQGTGTAQFQADTVSLNSNVGSIGGKVKYNSAPLDGIYRSVARAVDALPGNGIYYFSHTVNRGDIPQLGGDGFILTGFGNFVAPERGATSGFLAGIFVGFTQSPSNPGSFGDLVLRARTTTDQTAEDIVLIDGAVNSTFGQTYTVVIKVDITGSADPVSWWLNPTDFANGDDGMTSSSAASGSFSSFAFGFSGDVQRLNYASRDWNGNAFFDEPRIATDVADLLEIILGDVNGDGVVDLLDVQPFVDLLVDGGFQPEADINGDGAVDLLDVQPFIDLLTG